MRMTRALGLLVVVLGVGAAFVVMAPLARAQWDAHRPRLRQDLIRLADFGSGSAIGAAVRDVEQADVTRGKLPSSAGAVIEDVRPGSPAAKAGLQNGDVIVEFDAEKVRSARQLIRLVRETPDGRSVRVAIVRDGRRSEMEVTPVGDGLGPMSMRPRALDESFRDLAELGQRFHFDMRDFGGPMFNRSRLGVTVEDLTPQLASFFGVKNGVLVSSVRDDSPGASAGLRAGDVITALNQHAVAAREDLLRVLRDMDEERDVTIELTRDHKPMSVKATLEAAATGHGRRARLRSAV